MRSERIDKAVEIINYAITNHISVWEASKTFGHASTYVKNVKAVVYDLYDQNAISDELFNKFDEAYKRYEQGLTEPQTTEQEPFNEPASKVKLDITSKPPTDLPKTNGEEQTTFSADEEKEEAYAEWTWGKNYPPKHIKTLDELLNVCNVDLTKWKVDSHIVNKWDVTSWKSGVPITIENFQVKARLIRNKFSYKEQRIGEMFIKMVQDYVPPITVTIPKTLKDIANPPHFKEHNLFEVSIFDLHIGKLAWGGETFENYDVKIARERFLQTIETLIHRASGYQYERILFPVGNDFFNSDNLNNTTTKGTAQDEDLRWQKTFNVGTRLLIDAINMLKQTGVEIDVVVIPGNHDFERSFYMGSVLEAWFNTDSMVHVNNGASPRKYYKFGKVLLGLTHGGEEKETSLPLLMATDIESKPMWSETNYHEWHLGHIHRKRNVNYRYP